MCTDITETVVVSGAAKGTEGEWFDLSRATVYFDHPAHARLEHAINIDFPDAAGAPGRRVALELDEDSARALVAAVEAALARGAHVHA